MQLSTCQLLAAPHRLLVPSAYQLASHRLVQSPSSEYYLRELAMLAILQSSACYPHFPHRHTPQAGKNQYQSLQAVVSSALLDRVKASSSPGMYKDADYRCRNFKLQLHVCSRLLSTLACRHPHICPCVHLGSVLQVYHIQQEDLGSCS